MSNSQNHSPLERVAGLIMAFGVIAAFIYFVANPPEASPYTGPIIRFLAAAAAGYSAYLFVGSLELQGKLLGKVDIRAAGAFSAFIAVFLLFNFGIPQNTEEVAPIEDAVIPEVSAPLEESPPQLSEGSNVTNEPSTILEDSDLIELGALLRNMASLLPKPDEEAATWNKLRSRSSPIKWDTDYPGDSSGQEAYAWQGQVFMRINDVPDLDATGRSSAVWRVSAEGARTLISYISFSREQSLIVNSEEFEEEIVKSLKSNFQDFRKICDAGRFPQQVVPNVLFEGTFDNMTIPILLGYSVGASNVWPGLTVYFQTNSPYIKEDIACLN